MKVIATCWPIRRRTDPSPAVVPPAPTPLGEGYQKYQELAVNYLEFVT